MAQSYVTAHTAEDDPHTESRKLLALALGSVGVVYGDIGTSPLYAMKEAISAANEHHIGGAATILGVLSLMIWTVILIVTLKYVIILLRTDNKGEGGTFALMALGQSVAKRSSPVLLMLGITGAAFFYGDAILTPAMSVLSAVEGLKLLHPQFERIVLPLALIILFALFWAQARGTARMAQFFGPIMVIWFVVMALGGIYHIVMDPRVLWAFWPGYGISFMFSHGLISLGIMGLVFLCATGAEALYADLGHFGRKPIQFAWFALVLPCLLLNYMGQGSLLLNHPEAIQHPFYQLYAPWMVPGVIVLATLATVIASQAVITGAFSLTRQAIQLGLFPRQHIVHTSEQVVGQIYLPRVNWLLFLGVVIVIAIFRDFEPARRRLRRFGHGRDGDRLVDGVLRDLALLGLGTCQDSGTDRAAGADRAGVPDCQPVEDS